MTSTPTRPVDNVVITTKGLEDRNIHILDGMKVENKGKLIHYSSLNFITSVVETTEISTCFHLKQDNRSCHFLIVI